MVHPLVIIGSEDESGDVNLAPKHLAMPLSWDNHFGFVCTERHSTYHNINRLGYFTATFPSQDQILATSLSATEREPDDTKPALKALPMIELEGKPFLEGGYLFLLCEHHKTFDDFGVNSLITGKIVSAFVREEARRSVDKDDNDLIMSSPLLAYLHPGRFSVINQSQGFPLPERFKR